MEIKLNIKERLNLGNLFPNEDSYSNLIIRKDLIERVELKQDEVERLKIKSQNGQITWDASQEAEIQITLTNPEKVYISEILKKLDSEKKLNSELIDIYGKIV